MTIRKRGGIEYFYYLRTHKHGRREEIPLGTDKEKAIAQYTKIDIRRLKEDGIKNPAARKNIPWLATELHKRCRIAAKKREINFEITKENIEQITSRANGRCELTGIIFSFDRFNDKNIRPWSPSIDRIDSEQGYTKDNIRLVCTAVNLALNQFGEDVLMKISKALIKRKLGRVIT